MKKVLFSLVFILSLSNVFGKHISGGEMSYVYLGPGTTPGTAKYLVTLKLYRECNAPADAAQLDPTATFTVFSNIPYAQVRNIENIPGDPIQIVQKIPDNPCIDDAIESAVCFQTRSYSTTIDDLPITANGYIVAYQRCCRIDGMTNIDSYSVGSTYFAKIPGNMNFGAQTNTSPVFVSNDAVLICSGHPFNFDFSATDADGDSLVYAFYTAYSGGGPTSPPSTCSTCTAPDPAAAPPYHLVFYQSPYSAAQPMGSAVTINSHTGLISGTAPNLGVGANQIFDITVLVSEYRNGIRIGEHFKDLQVRVVDCRVATAVLAPKPATCDGFTVHFKNDYDNNPEPTYFWDFGDGSTDTIAQPSHTYATAGVYTLKLVLNRNGACADSTTSQVRVFPGFFPGFSSAGQCTNSAVQFTDQSTTNYPTINSWMWNFGDNLTSTAQSPSHVYTTPGSYTISLIVASDKGCVDTLSKTLDVYASPPLTVPNDTLICYIDTIQLNTVGSGSFLWSPNYMISDVTARSPFVSPDVTTTYTVTISDAFGCTGKDSVKVNVVNFVTLFKPADTTLCQGDQVVLRIVSDGLHYVWTPAASLNDPTIKNPIATPTAPTTYHVVANIGKCVSQADININTVPYPAANAGLDQEICYGASTQLQASGGSIYSWSPTIFLDNSHIANPRVIKPYAGVRYIVTVRDTLGCPKPVRDTVILNVDRLVAYAGSPDTSVVLGQPLQLFASGGTNYLWTPSTWLDDPTIHNPIALPLDDIRYFVRVSNNIGCFANGSIRVKVYKIPADLYVPSAFAPTGVNNIFRPILVGIRTLDLFRVYNRWGQMLYSGADASGGWDGTFGGKGQEAGTYVWYAEATDYKETKIKKKGYVVLIR